MLILQKLTDVSHNEITSIHEDVCSLSRLKVLEAGFNCLAVLPDSIGNLASLDRLTLQVRICVNMARVEDLQRKALWAHILRQESLGLVGRVVDGNSDGPWSRFP
jgi:hypothetical protein